MKVELFFRASGAQWLKFTDYDQIDGIVNNGKNPALAEKPQEKKTEVKNKRPSVLAKLRAYQQADRAQQSGRQHTEMEY